MKTWQFTLKYSNGMVIETWVEAITKVGAAQKLFRRKSAAELMLLISEDNPVSIAVKQVESRQLYKPKEG